MGVKEAPAHYRADLEPARADDDVPPGYQRTEVGVIPEDWGIASLNVVTDCLDNLRVPLNELQRDQRRGDVPYCGANGVLDFIDGFVIDDDIILMAEDGGYFDEYATRPIAYRMRGKCWVNNHAHILKTKDGFSQDFVFYSIVHKNILSYLASGTRAKLNRAEMDKIEIPLPPTSAEQQAIAEALSDADALIESLQQLIAKQRALKQGTMQTLLTGRQRLPGFTGEWQTKQLGELGNFRKGHGVSRTQSQSGSLPCVRYGEIYTTHNDYIRAFVSWISEEVAATATPVGRGDILFAGSGETKEEIGKCVAVINHVVAYAGGDIVVFRPRCGNPLFFGYVLNTVEVNRQKASRGQGDAVVHISAAALADVIIALPDEREQTAIAAVLSDMDAGIDALETRLAKTRVLKAGMMQQLLTGRIRLPLDRAA